MLTDAYNRVINYLRISVTDRCNLSCRYCAGEDVPYFSHSDILSYEEITRFVGIVARLGVKNVRLTGGEPLVRKGLPFLIQEISRIKEIEDIGLTTNGVLLGQKTDELKAAGLKRVNISLDTLKRDRYQYITGADQLHAVLQSIEKVAAAGLYPIKINTVMIRGYNQDETIDFVKWATSMDCQIRFIEFMSFGDAAVRNRFEPVPASEIERQIRDVYSLRPSSLVSGAGPARLFDIEGHSAKVGFITPLTKHFCASCNRIRLTSTGHIRLCLFADREYPMRELIRSGATDDTIGEHLAKILKEKPKAQGKTAAANNGPRTLRNIGG